MVFVTLGTSKYKFNRLINYIKNSDIKDIVVQSGHTKCPSSIKHFKILSEKEMNKYFKKADFVITHGGITIMELIKENKKVLAVPREKKYKEAINDHQFEMCRHLENEGYILVATNQDEFNKKIEKIKTYSFKEYLSNEEQFFNSINEIIQSYL